MKIILEHDEFIWLQKINRKPFSPKSIILHDNWPKSVSSLFNSGLVEFDDYCNSGRLEITDLGKQVLKEHSPWIEEFYDSRSGQTRSRAMLNKLIHF